MAIACYKSNLLILTKFELLNFEFNIQQNHK